MSLPFLHPYIGLSSGLQTKKSTFTTGVLGTFGSTAAHTLGLEGQAWSYKLTGLISGNPITSVGINAFATGGNIRLAVYADNGAGTNPATLLGQTGSTACSAGWNDVAITGVTVPVSGIVWLAFQADGGTVDIYYDNTVNIYNVATGYGAFPNPYGTAATDNLNRWNMRCSNWIVILNFITIIPIILQVLFLLFWGWDNMGSTGTLRNEILVPKIYCG